MNNIRVNLALCKAHTACTPITPMEFCAGVDSYPRFKLCREKARWLVDGEDNWYCTRHAADLVGDTPEGRAIVRALEGNPARRPVPSHITPAMLRQRSDYKLWVACWEGREPAEMLSTRDREDLVWNLHEQRLTDLEIAGHTRMSLYTAARIRGRLGLRPNQPHVSTAAA